MKKKYKKILVDAQIASNPKNQSVLADLSEKVLVVLSEKNIENSKICEYKIGSEKEPKEYALSEFMNEKRILKKYLYITKNLINVYRMNQVYNNVSCCFINDHTNDSMDIIAQYEVRNIKEIQKIKK